MKGDMIASWYSQDHPIDSDISSVPGMMELHDIISDSKTQTTHIVLNHDIRVTSIPIDDSIFRVKPSTYMVLYEKIVRNSKSLLPHLISLLLIRWVVKSNELP